MPMLEKKGERIFLLQYAPGWRRVKTEVERDTTTPYSRVTVRCGACKQGAHHFLHINEVIGIRDVPVKTVAS